MEAWELAGRRNIKLEKYNSKKEGEFKLPNQETLKEEKIPKSEVHPRW
jgi:hypothetical protein